MHQHAAQPDLPPDEVSYPHLQVPGNPEHGGSGRLSLTPRQRQVVQLLNSGRALADVAAHLGLTEATVRRYLADAKARVEAQNIRHLLFLARRSGLIADS